MVPCKRVAQVKHSSVQKFVETHVRVDAHVAPELVRVGSSGDVAKCRLFAQARGVLKVNVTFSVDFLTLARSLSDLNEARFV